MKIKIVGKTKFGIAAWLLFLALAACSAIPRAAVGEVKTETQSVELGGASSANVTIEMSAGKLTVAGGADQLMQASFRYNVEDWQPQVAYNVSGSQGELVVDQQGRQDALVGPNVVNEWDIRLSEGVPMDVEIHTGAGESNLDLSTLDVSTIRVEIGAGETNLDLSGNWDHDVNGDISGGVGKLTVRLPAEIGVRVNAETGLGNVTTSGLTQQGGGYVNQAYGSAPYTLNLDITAGVGAIELVVP
jgi:hypothetical protein